MNLWEQKGLEKRNINNGLVRHNLETNYNKILVCIHNKKCWKIVESSFISNCNII